MRVAKPLVIGASALALAVGYAFADKPANDPGFNALDKNNDGYLSRTEAAANPYLAKNFKKADKDGDGKLSRTEYLAVMTKKDLRSRRSSEGTRAGLRARFYFARPRRSAATSDTVQSASSTATAIFAISTAPGATSLDAMTAASAAASRNLRAQLSMPH